MESNSQKRKELIKTVAIVFLSALLLLTFFSSTILNRSLPEVAAQYAWGGDIKSAVRVSGTAEASKAYEVMLTEGRTVTNVNVQIGDTVAVGDVLFLLEDGESTELNAALDALNEAKTAYEKWKLQTDADIQDREQALAYAREDLQKIIDKGVSGKPNTAELDKTIAELEAKLAIYSLAKAQLEYDAAVAANSKAEAALLTAEKTHETATLAYEAASDAYNEANDILSSMLSGSDGAIRDQIKLAERELEDLEIARTRAEEAYNATKATYEEAKNQSSRLKSVRDAAYGRYTAALTTVSSVESSITEYTGKIAELEAQLSYDPSNTALKEALASAKGSLAVYQSALSGYVANVSKTEAEYNTADAAYTENEAVLTTSESEMKTQKQDLDDRDRAISRAKEDLAELKAKLGGSDVAEGDIDTQRAKVKEAATAQKSAEKALTAANDALTEAQTAVEEATAAEKEAKAALTEAKRHARPDGNTYTLATLETLVYQTEEALNAAHLERNELEENAGGGYPDKESYENAVTEAKRGIAEKETALARAKAENALDAPAYQTAIDRAQMEFDRLAASIGAPTVTAKVAGVIGSVHVVAGQTVEANTALATIEQKEAGYTVSASVTAQEAKRITVGQTATVLYYYWGETPTAVVESVKPDRNDPQNTRIVTLRLTGDITAGQTFEFSIGEKSAYHETVVPNSAIREDSKGKFVLVVTAKSTPVGNRYTAKRVDITVLSSDETSTAVTGLTGGEFVIVTASRPIAHGEQVRLASE